MPEGHPDDLLDTLGTKFLVATRVPRKPRSRLGTDFFATSKSAICRTEQQVKTLGTATHSFTEQRTAGTPFPGQLCLLRSLPAVSGCLKCSDSGSLVICPRASPRALRSVYARGRLSITVRCLLEQHQICLAERTGTQHQLRTHVLASAVCCASAHKVWQAIFGVDTPWQFDCKLHQLR